MDKPTRATADTIAAVATAAGRGGVGILRISGPLTQSLALALIGTLPAPRHATLATWVDGQGNPIDHGLALYFPAPHSFTGEAVLELQGHGGPVVLDLLLRRVLQLGARTARPGEFSERAFLNGKLDLAQAEAIADLIESGSEAAARAALRSLTGEFSQQVHVLVESLIALRLHIEAAIDFPEEEIDFLADGALTQGCAQLLEKMDALNAHARQGSLLREGMTVVLAGRPNAGKSSLLNALAQRDSAIVSAIPGTTRDVLREYLQIDGMPLHLIDTAGLRATTDDIEGEGVRRAQRAMQQADRILVLLDDAQGESVEDSGLLDQLPASIPYTVVHNKIDVSGRPPGLHPGQDPRSTDSGMAIGVSAQRGTGLDALRAHLKTCMGFQNVDTGAFSARRRHLDAIARARAHTLQAQQQLQQKRGELAAEELRLAQQTLGEVTGEFTSDDLLGRIFASFCIGK
jgi:tRNA modification GTPase